MTKRLLDKYEIKKQTMSYHAQSKLTKTDKIFELLKEGKDLALVSDAGTPTISDPGAMLISKIKEELKDEVQVIPIPGASAVITALSAGGFPTHEFTFLGFLPHKKRGWTKSRIATLPCPAAPAPGFRRRRDRGRCCRSFGGFGL